MVVRSFVGRVAVPMRGVVQPSSRTVSLRRALLAVALVLSIVCGIAVAAAATAEPQSRRAAEKAQAPVGAVRSGSKPAVGVVGYRGKPLAGVVRSRGKAPVRAVRYRGHTLGLVAPLSAQQGGAA